MTDTDALLLKPPPERLFARQLRALSVHDKHKKPANWLLSPQAVRTFIIGGPPLELEGERVTFERKFYGDDSLVERCVITLAGNRGLMLVGEPGTAKTMLSELLAAAISGTSLNTIQGTSGTTEDTIKYGWNYPVLLSKGPTEEALVPAPVYTGMTKGLITRFEEITRTPSEVQDVLISVMSDKVMTVAELGEAGVRYATPGFNIIATANVRDRGVNEMSSALKRRFNFETVFPVRGAKLEAEIIRKQAAGLLKDIPEVPLENELTTLLAVIFQELREGVTEDGVRIDRPSAIMSTAEAISVYTQSALSAFYYADGAVRIGDLVQHLVGTVAKDSREDVGKLSQYFQSVVKTRSAAAGGLWTALYEARSLIR